MSTQIGFDANEVGPRGGTGLSCGCSRARSLFLFVAVLCLAGFAVGRTAAQALVNPAAAYCNALGFAYEIETEEAGERGICVLPNRQRVDAWAFLQGKAGQEYSYCRKVGLRLKTVKDKSTCLRLMTEECAVCIGRDSTESEVTRAMNLKLVETTCPDGSCGIPENSATCPADCPSAGADAYCDGVKDGKCDPDCESGMDDDCAAGEEPGSSE